MGGRPSLAARGARALSAAVERARTQPPQKGDMRHTFADTQLARADLGFVPTVTLQEGLAAEHRWLLDTL